MRKQILSVCLAIILFAGQTVFALGFESNESRLKGSIEELEMYLINAIEDEAKLSLMKENFYSIGGKYGKLFGIYCEALSYLAQGRYELAVWYGQILEDNEEFISYLDEIESTSIENGSVLLTYIHAREVEANGDNETAVSLYQDCITYFDVLARHGHVIDKTCEQKYIDGNDAMERGDYETAIECFTYTSKFDYMNSLINLELLDSILLHPATPIPVPSVTPSPSLTPTPIPKLSITWSMQTFAPTQGKEPLKSYTAPTIRASTNSNEIYLSWGAVNEAVLYNVYRKGGSTDEWVMLSTVNDLTYHDFNVKDGTKYVYRVSAIDKDNHEEFSADKSITHSTKVWGAWSDWTTTPIIKSSTRDVDTKTQYRSRTKTYTTSSSSTLSGWELESCLPVSYGEWSYWADSVLSPSATTDVESGVFYRYYFYKHDCGWRSPTYYGYVQCPVCNDGEWYRIGKESLRELWVQTPYASANGTKYNSNTMLTTSIGSGIYYYETSENRVVTKYRRRDILPPIYTFYKWSSWSEWSDTSISAKNDTEVLTQMLYRYRDSK